MRQVKVTINVTKRSSDRLSANLQRKQESLRVAAKESVQQLSEKVFEKAQITVPVQTGALKNSGKITVKNDLDGPMAIISYGDSSTGIRGRSTYSYAPERHETATSRKPEAYKWLERALLEADVEFRDEVARLIAKALKTR